jgi:hypothetical protein
VTGATGGRASYALCAKAAAAEEAEHQQHDHDDDQDGQPAHEALLLGDSSRSPHPPSPNLREPLAARASRVRLEPFARLGRDVRRALEGEVERLEAFID